MGAAVDLASRTFSGMLRLRETQAAIAQSEIDERNRRRTEILRLLLSHNCDINVADNDGSTALHDALSNRHAGMVSLLLDYRPKVNVKTRLRIGATGAVTPLHLAHWSPELTRKLIDLGADESATASDGRTPAQWRIQAPPNGFGGRDFSF